MKTQFVRAGSRPTGYAAKNEGNYVREIAEQVGQRPGAAQT